ncbi:MAG: Bug family tripartite tricarboxylate transporter substrate binding protein [Candidatus Binatia bacterium]
MKGIVGLIALSLVLVLGVPPVPTAAGSFYEGKKIRLIVSSTPGGGNDTYSRLIARHIPKYIPGKPTMIVQNMPGGGGVVAANYLYGRARRDGTVMEQVNWGVWHYQAIKDQRARFDFNKMSAVGVAAIENTLIYCRTDRFKSLADIRKSGKKAKVGASGRQSTGFVLGNLLEKVLGVKLFEFVLGYPGARQYSLAVRQGELDCSGNTQASFLDQLGDMLKAGKLVPLAQSGNLDGKRDPMFSNIPLIKELPKTRKGKEIAETTFFFSHYGRPYALPPGVPKERVKLLRDAFWKTVHDPELLAEAKKLHRVIQPARGEKLQAIWKNDVNPPPKMLEIVQGIFGRKK